MGLAYISLQSMKLPHLTDFRLYSYSITQFTECMLLILCQKEQRDKAVDGCRSRLVDVFVAAEMSTSPVAP